MADTDLVSNRKVFHNYEILETFEAGIALTGTEVKSLRDHGGSLQDAYVNIGKDNSVILKNSSIAPYKLGNIYNHEERRDRKLLLHKREIAKLANISKDQGLTIVPLSMYFKGSYIKVKIGIARGKKLYDKRQDIKKRDAQRDIQQKMKNS